MTDLSFTQGTDPVSLFNDATGNQLAIDASGNIGVTQSTSPWVISAASLPLPAGAATETTLAKLPLAQASATSGQSGPLIQGAVTTAAPTYTTGQTSPFSLTTAGALRVDNSGVTQPVSGTVAATQSGTWNIGTLTSITNPVAVTGTFWQTTQPISASSLPLPTGAATETTLAAAKTDLDKFTFTATRLLVDGSGVTQPVSGTVAVSSLPSIPAGSNAIGSVSVSNFPATTAVTQSTSPWVVSGTVTANIGTTNGLALDATVSGLEVAQASTTSGQKGILELGAVTTVAPTYTTGQTSALSLTTAGALRVDNSGVTQPVSGTVTANAGTGTFTVGQATGTNLHTVVDSGTVAATQSGTWNITNVSGTVSLPTGAATAALQTTGNTSLSSIDTKTPALGQALMAASSPVVIASNQSAIPVSGTFWQTTQPVSGTVAVTQSTSPWVVSGTVTANLGTIAGVATETTLAAINTKLTTGTVIGDVNAAQKGTWNIGTVTAVTSITNPVAVTGTFWQTTQPVSGTVTANAGTGTFTVGQATGTNLHTVVDSGSITVSQATGTNLHVVVDSMPSDTDALAQGSTTSGQLGALSMGAVTTAAPSYTTAQTSPLSLTTAGLLRVDGSGVTQPISASSLPLPTGAATEATLAAINTKLTTGTVIGDVNASQKGTWNIGTLTSITNPVAVTGTFWQATQPISGTVAATQSGNWSTRTLDGAGTAITSTLVSAKQALDVNMVNSLTVGVADKTAFTYGTTSNQIQGGVYQDTAPTLTAGQSGAVRLTANRAQHANLRDASGNEMLGQKTMANSIPVTMASDQQLNPSDTLSSGNITALNGTVTLALTGHKSATLTVSGTWVGTLVGESSTDGGTTWVICWLQNIAATNLFGILRPINTSTSNGAYAYFNTSGVTHYRVRASAWTSGTAAIVITATEAPPSAIFTSTSIIQNVLVSQFNNSTANLGAGASFTGSADTTLGGNAIQICLFADQPLLVQVQQSTDGTNWDIEDRYTLTASRGDGRTIQAVSSWMRVIITNTGASTTTAFRLQTCLCPEAEPLARMPTEQVNGTITANGATITLNNNGYANVGFQVTGTWVGTLAFEATADNTNYFPVDVNGLSSDAQAGQTTVNGYFIGICPSSSQIRVRASAWTSGTAVVTILGNTNAGQVYAITDTEHSSTGASTNVASSAVVVTLLASNIIRKGATIYNDSTQNLFIKLGSGAALNSFTCRLIPQAYYELPYAYDGIVTGIWNIANGNARITEVN